MDFQIQDDGDELLVKALYVDPEVLNADADLDDGPPATAEEYIRQVAREANSFPDVLVADNKEHLVKRESKVVPLVKAVKGPDYLPSKDWIEKQVGDFSNFRLKLLRHKSLLSSGKVERKEISLPKLTNEKGWACFCFGKKFWNRVCVAREDSDNEENVKTKRSKAFDDIEKGHQPMLSYLTSLRPTQIVSLLEFHVEWAGDLEQVSYDQVLWLYGLLGMVEKPLHGDDISTIRSFGKLAIEYRKTQGVSQDVVYLNLIICIVANYFEQKDLSD